MGDIFDLAARVKNFCEDRNWDQYHSPKDLAIGLVTESSELLEIFRFKSSEECSKILQENKSKVEVEEELADVFFMLLRFSQLYEISLEEALKNKLIKNEKKYPVEKAYGSNKKYTDL